MPGHHPGSRAGSGFEVSGYAPLLSAPDPRRFDVRATLRDPFEALQVRVYAQPSTLKVYVLADLSASMGVRGRCRKLDLLADFSASLAYSAYRSGDAFGFIGCDTRVRTDFIQPPSRAKGVGFSVAEKLREMTPRADGATGLVDAAELITGPRALVFVASDFHIPTDLTTRIFEALARHAVTPVVFVDSAEFDDLPGFGLVRVRDAEHANERLLLIRPRLRERIRRAAEDRRAKLSARLHSLGRRPLFVRDHFDASRVTEYFYG